MHDSSQDRDYYAETIERIEPDIHMIDTGAGWASIAISLRRIADAMEGLFVLLQASARMKPLLPPESWP